MTNAKKCDRCSTLYSEQEIDTSNDYWRYSIIKDCHPYPTKKLDLCPTCQKIIAIWVENYSRDSEGDSI